MNDHYQTLGVAAGASAEDIKKAYRALAMKHHPDRGGDNTQFQSISEAYNVLSDQQKRAEYDMMRQGGGPQIHFHTQGFPGGFDIHDMFGQGGPFADIFGGHRGFRHRNRDLNLQCAITLLDAYTGKQLEASFQTPSGKTRTVVIHVPAGMEHGGVIRYEGLGDDSIPGVPAGCLQVTIIVHGDPVFTRHGNDLYTKVDINPIEAMIGCTKQVKTITGQITNLSIRPGVETGVEFAINNQGFTNPHNKTKGRFVCVINIVSTAITDKALVDKLTEINKLLSKEA